MEEKTLVFEEVAEMAHAKGYTLQYEEKGNVFWYNLYNGEQKESFLYLEEVIKELEESN